MEKLVHLKNYKILQRIEKRQELAIKQREEELKNKTDMNTESRSHGRRVVGMKSFVDLNPIKTFNPDRKIDRQRDQVYIKNS